MACWAMGRLLGPQLMVAGGGHPTHQWFGMYYAGQVGRRLPVPIFQALEDFAVYLILIAIERHLDRWPDGTPRVGYPPGIVLGTGMMLWGIERSLDEHLWLGEDGRLGSDLVQLAGVAARRRRRVILVRTRHAGDLARHASGTRGGSPSRAGGTAGLSSPAGHGPSRTGTEVVALALDGDGVAVSKIQPTSRPGRNSGPGSWPCGAIFGRCTTAHPPSCLDRPIGDLPRTCDPASLRLGTVRLDWWTRTFGVTCRHRSVVTSVAGHAYNQVVMAVSSALPCCRYA